MSALLYSSLEEDSIAPLSLSNRAFSYGDGVFETIRVVGASVPLLDYHRARFLRGVEVLRLGNTSELLSQFDAQLEAAITKMASLDHDHAIIKLVATRREGGRGYAPVMPSHCDVYVQVFEMPVYPESYYQTGIDACVCEYRLSEQPALAGIKHLNRLDQVLAASELGEHVEGIMLSQAGLVIEGTKSNVLLFSGEQVITPLIGAEGSQCGIRGTLLSALIAGEVTDVEVQQRNVSLEELNAADGLAMINSVFGVWPVRAIAGRGLAISNTCRSLQQAVHSRFSFRHEVH